MKKYDDRTDDSAKFGQAFEGGAGASRPHTADWIAAVIENPHFLNALASPIEYSDDCSSATQAETAFHAGQINRGHTIRNLFRKDVIEEDRASICVTALYAISKELEAYPELLGFVHPAKMFAEFRDDLITKLRKAAHDRAGLCKRLQFKADLYLRIREELIFDKLFFPNRDNLMEVLRHEVEVKLLEPIRDKNMFCNFLGSDGAVAYDAVYSDDPKIIEGSIGNLSKIAIPDLAWKIVLPELAALLVFELASHASKGVDVPEWLGMKYQWYKKLKKAEAQTARMK